jgi:hypothetical protein
MKDARLGQIASSQLLPPASGIWVIGALSFLTPTYYRSTSLGRIRCDDGKLPEENKRCEREPGRTDPKHPALADPVGEPSLQRADAPLL